MASAFGRVHAGDLEILLLSNPALTPAEVNAPDPRGRTPLWYAVALGRSDLVAALLARGAKADEVVEEGGKSLLYRAARQRNVGMMQLLLSAGAPRRIEPTALEEIRVGDGAVMELLLREGVPLAKGQAARIWAHHRTTPQARSITDRLLADGCAWLPATVGVVQRTADVALVAHTTHLTTFDWAAAITPLTEPRCRPALGPVRPTLFHSAARHCEAVLLKLLELGYLPPPGPLPRCRREVMAAIALSTDLDSALLASAECREALGGQLSLPRAELRRALQACTLLRPIKIA